MRSLLRFTPAQCTALPPPSPSSARILPTVRSVVERSAREECHACQHDQHPGYQRHVGFGEAEKYGCNQRPERNTKEPPHLEQPVFGLAPVTPLATACESDTDYNTWPRRM